ncbi:MAG: hypothetical protein PF447_00410 [Spirochaetaceae bacterium]|jgi:hypothetical protein|nr:hypothetical protein [Spirochaetaceae bacterium]
MKKIIVLWILVAANLLYLNAEKTNWMMIGVQSSALVEQVTDGVNSSTSTMSSQGLSLSSYMFKEDNRIGLWVHDSFLVPVSLESEVNGITTTTDLSVYDFLLQTEILIGPGYRVPITNALDFHGGIGLHLLHLNGIISQDNYSYSLMAFNWGIGGEAALKLNIGEGVYFDVGSILAIDTQNFMNVNVSGYDIYGSYTDSYSDWTKDYLGVTAKFFLGIGYQWVK